MPTFMIELSHTPETCVAALDELDQNACDLLSEVYWGCMSGRHDGWVVVEAENESAARELVPGNVRGDVTITEVDVATLDLAHDVIDPNAAHPGDAEPSGS
jgi:hypothetical protein